MHPNVISIRLIYVNVFIVYCYLRYIYDYASTPFQTRIYSDTPPVILQTAAENNHETVWNAMPNWSEGLCLLFKCASLTLHAVSFFLLIRFRNWQELRLLENICISILPVEVGKRTTPQHPTDLCLRYEIFHLTV